MFVSVQFLWKLKWSHTKIPDNEIKYQKFKLKISLFANHQILNKLVAECKIMLSPSEYSNHMLPKNQWVSTDFYYNLSLFLL